MTIRFLTPWGQYALGAAVSLTAAEEAQLVAAGLATTDLTGGVPWFSPGITSRRIGNVVMPMLGRSGVVRLYSTLASQTLSAGAGTGRTLDVERSVDAPHLALQPVFGNWSRTNPLTINKWAVGTAGAHQSQTIAAIQAAGRWVNGSFAAGSSASGIVPVASIGTLQSAEVMPGLLAGDPVSIPDTARTDGGATPMTRWLVSVADSVETGLLGSATRITAINANPSLYGGHQTAGYTQQGDAIASKPGTSLLLVGHQDVIVAVRAWYQAATLGLAAFGDSRGQGLGSTGDYAGSIMRTAQALRRSTLVTSWACHAIAGQTHLASMATIRNTLAEPALRPEVMGLEVGSPNSLTGSLSTTAALAMIERCWTDTCQTVAYAASLGIVSLIRTSPAHNLSATNDVYRRALNQRLRDNIQSLPNAILIDAATVIDDPATGYRTLLAAYNSGDGVHYNDAGYAAISALEVAALQPFFV
ncbi:SGNH/GDSL hydrolase family protein [Derxia gummosa]|uniref:SGNH/GDSL hydrolase family protein n=1 Tax=Derxia gummosa DSM 723 TaxID=1121388 RepID=A0A8B6XAR6_9BURK|nr:SGNH/GDSL hydrolase family protein [Derxia gummosa]